MSRPNNEDDDESDGNHDSSNSEDSISSNTFRNAQLGDELAWATIWATYCYRVERQIFRANVVCCDVPDVMTLVFEKVWRKLHLFSRSRSSDSMGAWISTITENTITDYFRKRGRDHFVTGFCGLSDVGEVLPSDSELSTHCPQSLLTLSFWRALGVIENETSDRDMECLRLVRSQAMTQQEITQQLSISNTNVSTVASRVFKRLREESLHQLRQLGYELDASGKLRPIDESDQDRDDRGS